MKKLKVDLDHEIKRNIKKLFDSGITNYSISKSTGIPQSTLSDIKKGKVPLGKIALDRAVILSNFYLEHVEEIK